MQRFAQAGVDLDDAVRFINAGVGIDERHLFTDPDLLQTLAALRGPVLDGCRLARYHPHRG